MDIHLWVLCVWLFVLLPHCLYEMSKPVIKAPTHGYAFVGALCLVIRVVTALPFEMSKPVIKAPTHGYSLNPKP